MLRLDPSYGRRSSANGGAARRRAQEVGDGDQQRERYAGIGPEERDGDDLEVPCREDDRRGG
jgi:hypothetical protein